jgi:hypothetical protein
MRTQEEVQKEIDYHKEKCKWLDEFILYCDDLDYEKFKPIFKSFHEKVRTLEWVINNPDLPF